MHATRWSSARGEAGGRGETTTDCTNREDWAGLLEVAAEVVWPLDRSEIPPGDEIHVASSSLRVRVSRLLRACAILVRVGYGSESAGLVRSIWEDAVSAAFIAESPKDRAKRWLDFAELRRIHHLKRGAANPDWLTPEVVADLGRAVEGRESSTGSDWAGTSASSLAMGLKSSKNEVRALLGRDFGIYYETLCDDSHGSPYAVVQLLALGGEFALVNLGPDSGRMDELPFLAIYGAWQFAHAIHSLGGDIDESGLRGLVEDAQRIPSHS